MRDLLSNILDAVSARSYVSTGLVTGGDWAIHIPSFEGLKFNAVVRGTAWLAIEGGPIVQLQPGDCFILTGSVPFVMASELCVPAVPAHEAYADAIDGIAYYGFGRDFFVVGGRMVVDLPSRQLLLDGFPSLLLLRRDDPGAAVLQWLIERCASEIADPAPGSAAMAGNIMQMMFIAGMRAWLQAGPPMPGSWVGALADRRIAAAVTAMHERLNHNWTLPELANIAGMSRANFARKFAGLTGTTPLRYLARWRLQLASRRLRDSSDSVSAIALSSGYGSESAFSAAFKREYGEPPSRHRV